MSDWEKMLGIEQGRPVIVRKMSLEPRDGFVEDLTTGLYMESDESLRKRIREAHGVPDAD
ncbi:MAG: hypothetical protein ACWGPR_11525 [Candidatus Deferrimicrobiaceae bacterium]